MIDEKKYVNIVSASSSVKKEEIEIKNKDVTITENGNYVAEAPYTGFGRVRVAVPTEAGIIEELNVSSNGTYTPSGEVSGFSPVIVNVPEKTLGTKTITTNGSYNATDDGVDGFSSVEVNVSGVTPTGTIDITTNGIYDVAEYANARVEVLSELRAEGFTKNGTYIPEDFDGWNYIYINVPTSGGGLGVPKKISNGILQNGDTLIDLTGVTNLDDYVLTYQYYMSNITGNVDFSGLTTISGNSALKYCFYMSKITGATFTNLETITNNSVFEHCFSSSNITNISFPKLKSITSTSTSNGYTFAYCFDSTYSLNTATFDSLETINSAYCFSYAFSRSNISVLQFPKLKSIDRTNAFEYVCSNCSNLTEVIFDSLETIDSFSCFSRAFQNCSMLGSIEFPALAHITKTNTFNNAFTGCSDIEIHFPAAIEATIRGLQGYSDTAPFGATSGTVIFDL